MTRIQVVPTDTGEAWLEDVDILRAGERIEDLPTEEVIMRGLKFADSADVPARYVMTRTTEGLLISGAPVYG
jgi:hypothetical protein